MDRAIEAVYREALRDGSNYRAAYQSNPNDSILRKQILREIFADFGVDEQLAAELKFPLEEKIDQIDKQLTDVLREAFAEPIPPIPSEQVQTALTTVEKTLPTLSEVTLSQFRAAMAAPIARIPTVQERERLAQALDAIEQIAQERRNAEAAERVTPVASSEKPDDLILLAQYQQTLAANQANFDRLLALYRNEEVRRVRQENLQKQLLAIEVQAELRRQQDRLPFPQLPAPEGLGGIILPSVAPAYGAFDSLRQLLLLTRAYQNMPTPEVSPVADRIQALIELRAREAQAAVEAQKNQALVVVTQVEQAVKKTRDTSRLTGFARVLLLAVGVPVALAAIAVSAIVLKFLIAPPPYVPPPPVTVTVTQPAPTAPQEATPTLTVQEQQEATIRAEFLSAKNFLEFTTKPLRDVARQQRLAKMAVNDPSASSAPFR